MGFKRRKPAAIGVKARFSGFDKPALATSILGCLPANAGIHEIKFDGYLVQLHIVDDSIHIYTRPAVTSGRAVSARSPATPS
jgi:bifunctional non-homologous end joining protein LigD